ncbi:sugar ABC transporter substrate-binding protein [Bauldia litoralis]|uniref:Monosaccharide ABC transporter substrate-binding protein, CUT2 family (TC 3.A.1.2.-) n=1 Tax=Bauldia litoralis TaxID=665467 RepID=A0A1G6E762_9HYPH|nr:sugar ABC transporter substrate-binding protein [Bauldia litoralis]SDB53231.1 monosaccharide ABC transporter substrate-binding protein, CUT2 family (TC 3.A.1.2.-) [Bauldia litoralis]
MTSVNRSGFPAAIGVFAIAATALATGALASDNKIALIPGGPHPYFAPWEQAAADAQKDFDIAAVDFKVPAEWKLNLQTELLESLAAQGYSAFGIFPGDSVGINSTVTELQSAGLPSAALAGCAQDPTDMAFCLGTDVYNSAYIGTKELIKAMGGKGNIVHLAGLLVDPNTTLRVKAVETAVEETNGEVTLLQTVADTDAQEAADQKISALLAAQKDEIGGMIATGYIPSVVASKLLRTLGDKRIKFIGIDDDQIVLKAIEDGFVAGTMAQNPYGQGYIGAYALDLLASGDCTMKEDAPWIETPQTARFIDSGTMVINLDNIASYKDDLKAITADIQGKFKDTYMTCS